MQNGYEDESQENKLEEMRNLLKDEISDQVKKIIESGEFTGELRGIAADTARSATRQAVSSWFGDRKTVPISEMNFDGAALLSHLRSLFEYHAGQRLNSIRYFFVAYSLFATAYFTAQGIEDKTSADFIGIVTLCLVAAIVSGCFWALDRRNSELVEIDELALLELESHAAVNHDSRIESDNLRAFQITERSDMGLKSKNKLNFRYKGLLSFIFSVFIAVAILGAVGPANELCAIQWQKKCLGAIKDAINIPEDGNLKDDQVTR